MFSTLLLAANSQQGSPLTLLFIPLMFVAMYFLMIRPQRRRQKETAALQSALGEGDEVITTSGMYGFITGFDGDIVWLEVDDNIQIRVARAAVQRKVDTSGSGKDAVSAESQDVSKDGSKDGSKASTDIADIVGNDDQSGK